MILFFLVFLCTILAMDVVSLNKQVAKEQGWWIYWVLQCGV